MTQPIQQPSNLHFRSDASQSNSLSSAGKVGLILGLIGKFPLLPLPDSDESLHRDHPILPTIHPSINQIQLEDPKSNQQTLLTSNTTSRQTAGVTLIVLVVIFTVLRLKRGPSITLSSFLPHPSKKSASLRNLPSSDIERALRSRATDRSASRATTTRTTRTTRTGKSSVGGGRRHQTSSPATSHSYSHRTGASSSAAAAVAAAADPFSLDKELGLKKSSSAGGDGSGGRGRGWVNVTARDFHADQRAPGPTRPLNTSRGVKPTAAVTVPVSAYATPHERIREPVRVPENPVTSPRVPPSPAFSRLTTSTRSSAALPSIRFMTGMRKSEEA